MNHQRSQCTKPSQQHNGAATAAYHPPFELHLAHTDTPVVCGVVVIASGLSIPNAPATMSGIELTKGYEDLQESGEEFEGKTVAVIGMGTHTCMHATLSRSVETLEDIAGGF